MYLPVAEVVETEMKIVAIELNTMAREEFLENFYG